jgi:predicted dehydrogenase
MLKSHVKLLIIGAGIRGTIYANYVAAHPDQARVVGVAEPRQAFRWPTAQAHNIPAEKVTADWRELASKPKFADAVIIATPDNLHVEPAQVIVGKRQEGVG